MAVPANTLQSVSVAGNREDLSNEIHTIVPQKTPFYSNIGRATADATYTEWQEDSLDAVDTDNAHTEGDDTAAEPAHIPNRLGGVCQIFKKGYQVSGTQQAVDTAGIEDMIDYQKMKKLAAMKRDIEYALLSKQASANPTSGTIKRYTGGALAWCETNTSRGTGGANGGFASGAVSAPTDGTLRTFTEALLKSVMQQLFNTTGDVTSNLQAYMSANHKELFGAFPGLSDTRDQVSGRNGKRVIYGAADVYVSHYGTITAIPHAYTLTRDVFICDPSYWKVATLRKAEDEPLAKTGDSDKRQIVTELALKSCNEKSAAVIADLTP